jgi:transposase
LAILEKEVWVSLGAGNDKYYEKLGYHIPRYKTKDYKLSIKKGTKILVKVDDLPKACNIRLTKVCDEENCENHVPNQTYEAILRNRDKIDGKDRCGDCGRKRAGKTQKNNIRNGISLELWSKENNKQYLLDEFSDNNIKKPNQISYGSADLYLWECPNCDNQYEMSVHHRTSGSQNCPYCSNPVKRILIGFNDLWTTHSEVAELLNDQQVGYKYSSGSTKKVEFKCNKCNNIDKKTIVNVVRQGFSCSKCSDGLSYPEKFMIKFLDQLNINYEKQKTFEWSDNVICDKEYLNGKKKYDFYIPSVRCIIEVHGVQHYEKSFETIETVTKTLEEEQENDELKQKLAIENGYEFIVIDARKSKSEWIKKSILNSKINKFFNLLNINWIECNILVRTACDHWNEGIKSAKTISELLNCGRNTAIGYLKKGTEIGWCDYDPKEEIRKSKLASKPSKRIKIIQLSKDNNFIKEWESITKASEELDISDTCIINVCKGRQKTAGGLKWVYKEDYDAKINEILNIN